MLVGIHTWINMESVSQQVIQPEDLCVPKPDELSVITYVSYYCGQESPGKNALLEWINSKIPEHKISNFTSDWKNGVAIGCLTDVVSGGMFPDYEGMNPDDPDAVRQIIASRVPLGRYATPDEIAAVTAFLCSDDAAYMTGTVVPIDGGSQAAG